MNWDSLLADLESRFDAERRADLAAEAAELAEAEVASLRLADRLHGAVGRTVHLRTRGGTSVDGVVSRAEEAFVLLTESEGMQSLVPLHAIALATPLPGPAPAPAGRRPTIQAVLRRLARAGARVRVVFAAGEFTGRLARVGADYIDVIHDGAAPGRAPGAVTIALPMIEVIRSR
ncbi:MULTISPECIES: Fis family transcriptional regulator [unclassified Actinomyces]|uniref:Fis family transcriptional regulator n=1 Tax=unclassified Actinomyces TaxID=2609248 RepID=UPI0013A6EF89|nr:MULTISPECIES: Fis family transcriptional regulator [unclassified Actinomyces]MBW3068888.1 Fis family transcriptional regulator [Actinomyces sp. 594]NDR52562.1 Fis family transcriptional regulator [Actinomyces sp. 565]